MLHIILQLTEEELLIYFEGPSWKEALSLLNNETVNVTQLSYKLIGQSYYYLDELGDESGEGWAQIPDFVHAPIKVETLIRQLEGVDFYCINFDGEDFNFTHLPGLGFLLVFNDYTISDKHQKVLDNLLGKEGAEDVMRQTIANGIYCSEALKPEMEGKEFVPFLADRYNRFQDEQNRLWFEEQSMMDA